MLKLAGELIEGQLADHIARLDAHTRDMLEVRGLNQYQVSPLIADYIQSAVQVTLTANRLYAVPYPIIRDRTPDIIWIQVQAADASNSNLRLGIYADDGSGYPGARVTNGGVVSVATTGIKTVAYTTQLTKGLYWIALIADGTPAIYYSRQVLAVIGSVVNANTRQGYYKDGAYGNLPDPFPDSGVDYPVKPFTAGFRFTSND